MAGVTKGQRQPVTLVQRTAVLNRAVHHLLLGGLTVSAALLLAGVAVVLARGQPMPSSVLGPAAAFEALRRFEAPGLLSVGLIVLVATPVLRVVGSIFTFLYERDFRYALVTTVVLAVLAVSVLIGRGG